MVILLDQEENGLISTTTPNALASLISAVAQTTVPMGPVGYREDNMVIPDIVRGEKGTMIKTPSLGLLHLVATQGIVLDSDSDEQGYSVYPFSVEREAKLRELIA